MLGYGYYYDPTYILVLIGALLSLWASAKVKDLQQICKSMTAVWILPAQEADQQILKNAGIYGVRVEHISGNLTDHYDPKAKVLRLSDSVYSSRSVAAVGVAAHECGHAIQDDVDYIPLRFRSAFVPVANTELRSHADAFCRSLFCQILSADSDRITVPFSSGVYSS